MKRVILEEEKETVCLSEISEFIPIFGSKENRLKGMIVKEERGWIFRTGGLTGCSGHHDSRDLCISNAESYGYTFHVED